MAAYESRIWQGADRTVLIGADLDGQDRHPTPLSLITGAPMLGVAVHVQILAGLVFFLGAAVGLVRFPDFYTRMHAAGKGDTLSSLLVVLGLAVWRLHDVHGLAGLREHWSILLVILKLLAICAFGTPSPASRRINAQSSKVITLRSW